MSQDSISTDQQSDEKEDSLSTEAMPSAEGDQSKLSIDDTLKQQLVESEDQRLRIMAEFANFKKRIEADKPNWEFYGKEKIVKDLLPIIDNFTKAVDAGNKNQDFSAFYDGIILIKNQLDDLLSKHQIEAIEALGKEFDPTIHQALHIDEGKDVETDTVIEEWQRGYKVGDKIIRPAQVVVAKAKVKAEHGNAE